MAMRRARFRRRGAPFKRQTRNWLTTNFLTTVVPIDATLLQMVCFDPLSSQVLTSPFQYMKHYEVRRWVFNGVLGITPQNASASGFARFVWAAFVIDREDSDATLLSTGAGDIMEGGAGRVLQTGVLGANVMASATNTPYVVPTMELKFDVKVGMKLKPDQQLAVGIQAATSLVTFVEDTGAVPIICAVSRVLLIE